MKGMVDASKNGTLELPLLCHSVRGFDGKGDSRLLSNNEQQHHEFEEKKRLVTEPNAPPSYKLIHINQQVRPNPGTDRQQLKYRYHRFSGAMGNLGRK